MRPAAHRSQRPKVVGFGTRVQPKIRRTAPSAGFAASSTVEQQRDPDLGHRARLEEALLLPRPAVDPAGQTHPVEQLADQRETVFGAAN